MAGLLGATTMTLLRPEEAGAYVNGVWIEADAVESTITGSFQPLRGREREELPEGYRTEQTAKLYTRTELRVLDLETQTDGDIIKYKDRYYWVIAVADWTDHARPTQHYKYLLSEIGEDQDPPGGVV